MLVARKVGPVLRDSAPYVPSTNDFATHWNGVFKRMLNKMPDPVMGIYRELRNYVRVKCNEWFQPLPADYDLSDLFWLLDTNYTTEKKIEYVKMTLEKMDKESEKVDTHDKLESLGDELNGMPKNVRCINARKERFRLFWGKFSKAMEHCAMGSGRGREMFAKYWKVSERSHILHELMDEKVNAGWKIGVNDYTSWEANMRPKLMNVCEIQFYRYMLKNIDKKLRNTIMSIITRVFTGRNKCSNKFGRVCVQGTRMSGEMSTSLGNGVTNLFCTSFVLSRKGLRSMIVVEGDDAVILTPPGKYDITSHDFAEVGLKSKYRQCVDLADAEFCSTFAAAGVGDNCADVFDVFNRTGWSMATERFAKPSKCLSLLRAKAFSLLYEFPRAPVVRAYADYLLRITEGSVPIFEHGRTTKYTWWTEQVLRGNDLKQRPNGTVHPRSRDLVLRKYGISIEMQLKYEAYFMGLNTMIDYIPNWCFDIPEIRSEHCRKFVRHVPSGYQDMLVRW